MSSQSEHLSADGIPNMWMDPMIRGLMVGVVACAISSAAFAQAQFGTAAEAKAMIERTASALRADRGKALAAFNAGGGDFRDRDLYPFCANAGDGEFTAHPILVGKNMKDVVDKNGFRVGDEIRKVATEGTFNEVTYMWPRPGTDATPVQKVSFVTKVGDQICGVGYYK